jgi:hypothetical protein
VSDLDEPAEVFALLRGLAPERNAALRAVHPYAVGTLACWAPISLGADWFQPHERGARAPRSAWHWVFSVRAWRGPAPGGCEPRFGALFGGDIVDLLAVSPDLARPLGLLIGAAAVLGAPQNAPLADGPVRIERTPLGWLRGGCVGVLPLLTVNPLGAQSWMRELDVPMVARDLEHAERLLAFAKRDLAAPKVMVAA